MSSRYSTWVLARQTFHTRLVPKLLKGCMHCNMLTPADVTDQPHTPEKLPYTLINMDWHGLQAGEGPRVVM